jgi:hypothetical protein
MKSKEELQQDYEQYLAYLRCGKYGFTYDTLDSHSIEELETLAGFVWNDEIGLDLYRIFILRRKRKMNMQLICNQENIKAIIHIDKQLKECCRQLKKETEDAFHQMLEQRRKNFSITAVVDIIPEDSFLHCAVSVLDGQIMGYPINSHDNIESVNNAPIFSFEKNYAKEILAWNTDWATFGYQKLEAAHIGYPFYKLYHKSCLSLQDIFRISEIRGEIELHYYF